MLLTPVASRHTIIVRFIGSIMNAKSLQHVGANFAYSAFICREADRKKFAYSLLYSLKRNGSPEQLNAT